MNINFSLYRCFHSVSRKKCWQQWTMIDGHTTISQVGSAFFFVNKECIKNEWKFIVDGCCASTTQSHNDRKNKLLGSALPFLLFYILISLSLCLFISTYSSTIYIYLCILLFSDQIIENNDPTVCPIQELVFSCKCAIRTNDSLLQLFHINTILNDCVRCHLSKKKKKVVMTSS